MVDKAFYNRYKSIKESFDYVYKGYNLKYLVPGYLTFIFAGESSSARDVFKEFYTGTQLLDLSKISEVKSPHIITYLINRADYKDLADAASKLYPDSDVINIESLPLKKVSCFSFSYIRHICKAFGIVFTRPLKESFMTKLFFVGLVTKLLNYIHLLEKSKFPESVADYICFNSAYKEESILTLYFKKRNVETITLQHGIFCDFKLFIPFDYINFDNLIADKVLCWGQSTIDYLSSNGFDKSRLILMGNPKYLTASINHIDKSFTKCLVLLGRAIYIPTNNKLLTVLRDFNRKHNNKILFYIKKHPFLMDEEHKTFAGIADNMIFLGREHQTQEVLRSDMVNFSISVNTTAYYESLALGKLSFRWAESENEEFYGMDDKFNTIEEFELKMKEFELKSDNELKNEMKEVIKYVFNPNLK